MKLPSKELLVRFRDAKWIIHECTVLALAPGFRTGGDLPKHERILRRIIVQTLTTEFNDGKGKRDGDGGKHGGG